MLDFPSSPTTGQTYTSGGRTWRYNGTAWVNANPLGSGVYVGVTPPGNPSTYPFWWDSSVGAGQLKIYFTDANSSQWVDAFAAVPGPEGPAGPAATGGGGSTNVWVPASNMIPKSTGGCGVNSSESTTNKQNIDSLDFDTAVDEAADFMLLMPNNYNGGTVTGRFYWTADSGTGTVEFGLKGRAFGDDDALDQAAGTEQAANDTLLAAFDMHVSPLTAAITIAGTPAAGKPIQFTITRKTANDNLPVDARLLGVEILYTAA
jgi:hypothetical protein